MVDHNALGATGETFEMDVERGKIAEFARSIQTENPAYTGPEAVAPPTFLTTMFHWERGIANSNPWPQVEMSQARGMHAEQEYIFHGPPPRAGDRLSATSRIDSNFEKEGRRGGALTFVVMVTEFRNAEGKLVAEARMTAVETARPPEEAS